MNKTKLVTVTCLAIAAVVMAGLAVWIFLGFSSSGQFAGPSGTYSERGSYSVPSTDIDALSVDWVSGEVAIIPYDGDDIIFKEYAGRELDDKEALSYDVNGGSLRIKYSAKAFFGISLFQIPEKRLEVFVPHDAIDDLSIDSTSADISLSDFSGATCSISTVSGKMAASAISCDRLEVDSTSGSVSVLDSLVTDAKFSTVSGDLKLSGEFTNLRSGSTSGGIMFTGQILPKSFYADTVSGDVIVTIPQSETVSVDFDSVSGDLTYDFDVIISNNPIFKVSTTSGNFRIMAL